jgi:amidase
MTKNVIDSAIVSVMTGEDSADPVTENSPKDNKKYWEATNCKSKGVRFGVNKTFLKDSIYKLNVAKIVALGGIAIEFEL